MKAGNGWLGPLEAWTEARLVHVVEPRMQRWIERWMRSVAGRQMMTEVVADVVVDAVQGGDGGSGLLEELVVHLNRRLAERPGVRSRLLEALGAPVPRPGG